MEVSFVYVAELLPDVIELQFAIELGSILIEGNDILDGLGVSLLLLTRDAGFL
jgi:hypothetical protein